MQGQEAKYQQVIDWVRQNIENGTFRTGDKLMSENELENAVLDSDRMLLIPKL